MVQHPKVLKKYIGASSEQINSTMNNEGLDEGGGDNAPEANVIPVAGAIESLDDYVRRNGIRHADENGMHDDSYFLF